MEVVFAIYLLNHKMGFFDFLKTKKQEKIEIIEFKNLKEWINNKKDLNDKKEEIFIFNVKDRIKILKKDIDLKIEGLKRINFNEKKSRRKS